VDIKSLRGTGTGNSMVVGGDKEREGAAVGGWCGPTANDLLGQAAAESCSLKPFLLSKQMVCCMAIYRRLGCPSGYPSRVCAVSYS